MKQVKKLAIWRAFSLAKFTGKVGRNQISDIRYQVSGKDKSSEK
jgi:hypothetical protein